MTRETRFHAHEAETCLSFLRSVEASSNPLFGGAGVGLLLNILHQLEPDLNYGHEADDHDNQNDDNDFSVATSSVRFLK